MVAGGGGRWVIDMKLSGRRVGGEEVRLNWASLGYELWIMMDGLTTTCD